MVWTAATVNCQPNCKCCLSSTVILGDIAGILFIAAFENLTVQLKWVLEISFQLYIFHFIKFIALYIFSLNICLKFANWVFHS